MLCLCCFPSFFLCFCLGSLCRVSLRFILCLLLCQPLGGLSSLLFFELVLLPKFLFGFFSSCFRLGVCLVCFVSLVMHSPLLDFFVATLHKRLQIRE